jgi:hypothetical protein
MLLLRLFPQWYVRRDLSPHLIKMFTELHHLPASTGVDQERYGIKTHRFGQALL